MTTKEQKQNNGNSKNNGNGKNNSKCWVMALLLTHRKCAMDGAPGRLFQVRES
jgi:hypothetical protein